MTVAWVVGSSGMLGSAVVRAVEGRGGWRHFAGKPLPWNAGPAEIRAAALASALGLAASADGGPWAVIWTAGAAVTSSSNEAVDAEYLALTAALEGMRDGLRESPGGSFFYSSSAGGIYAGSTHAPFDEKSEPHPLSPYGAFKLRAEVAVSSAAAATGADCLIGRISNLYGPGQRLDKLQGLISHLALARLTPRPASIYVSLDTLRDYIYVDDCATVVLDGLDRLRSEHGVVTKVIASGQSTSIAALLGYFRGLSKGRPRVVLGVSASGAHQARDLRLRSVVWPELDAYRATDLPEGISATVADVFRALQAGSAR